MINEKLSETRQQGTPTVVPNRKIDAKDLPNYDYIFGCSHKDKRQAISLRDYFRILEKEKEKELTISPTKDADNITSFLFKLKGYDYIGNKDAFCFLSKALAKNKTFCIHWKKLENFFKLEISTSEKVIFEASSLRKCFELANIFFAN